MSEDLNPEAGAKQQLSLARMQNNLSSSVIDARS
jgi:hypothetical protein